MRINHNIAALNAYRNLSVNNENTSKSLEKLSSGLRINRAADDAAGLAISEKMRSQIRGLDMASRNAMDGISVVQTADGSLNSTTEILQRMRELTVQAANDSNTDTDRQNIQKEIDQLTTEVNRIGNSTEFNTKSLLNGSLSIIGDAREIKANSAAGTFGPSVTLDPRSVLDDGSYKVDITKSSGTPYQSIGAVDDTTGSAVPITLDAINTANNSDVNLPAGNYQVVLSNQVVKVTSNMTSTGADVLNNSVGNNPITIDVNSLLSNGTYHVGVSRTTNYSATPVSSGGISNAVVDTTNPVADGAYTINTKAEIVGATDATGGLLLSSKAISNISIKNGSIYSNADKYQITVSDLGPLSNADGTVYGENYEFDLVTNNTTPPAPPTMLAKATASVSNTAGTTQIQLGDVSFDVDNVKFWNGTSTNSFAGNTINLSIGNEVTVTQNSTGLTQTTGPLTDDAAASTKTFTFNGGKLSLKVDDTLNSLVRGASYTTTVSHANSWKVQMYESNGTTARGSAVTLNDTDVSNPSKLANIQVGNPGDGLLLDLDSSELQSMQTFTTSVINFNVSQATTTIAQVKDINSVAKGNAVALSGTTSGSIVDLGNNMKLSYDGSKAVKPGIVNFTVNDVTPITYQMSLKQDVDSDGFYERTLVSNQDFNLGDKVLLKGSGVEVQTSVGTTSADYATFSIENGVTDNSAKLQIGANAGQTVSLEINDMRATALQLSTDTSGGGLQTVTLLGGKNQQVWFTTDPGANDGSSDNKPQYSLDVTSNDKAQAAMAVIDDAVQRVSSERARLGAIQNRLEYTVDNLKTMSENVTSSESRIRDVDTAEEMTKFTKNNILNQAAQAMLAQANQLPQGVLQLLK